MQNDLEGTRTTCILGFLFPDLWRTSLDPCCLFTCDSSQPSRMGDVCVNLLLHHDLHMAGDFCLWRTQEQCGLGSCGKAPAPRFGKVVITIQMTIQMTESNSTLNGKI